MNRVKFTDRQAGDHIVVKMKIGGVPYDHHGIYCGSNEVIHYDGNGKCIKKVSLKDFVGKDHTVEEIEELVYPCNFRLEQIVERANKLARAGFVGADYDLLTKNCEHIAYFCRLDKWTSQQVDALDTLNNSYEKMSSSQKSLLTKRLALISKYGSGKAGIAVIVGVAIVKGLHWVVDNVHTQESEIETIAKSIAGSQTQKNFLISDIKNHKLWRH